MLDIFEKEMEHVHDFFAQLKAKVEGEDLEAIEGIHSFITAAHMEMVNIRLRVANIESLLRYRFAEFKPHGADTAPAPAPELTPETSDASMPAPEPTPAPAPAPELTPETSDASMPAPEPTPAPAPAPELTPETSDASTPAPEPAATPIAAVPETPTAAVQTAGGEASQASTFPVDDSPAAAPVGGKDGLGNG